jgi:hypothetical protein
MSVRFYWFPENVVHVALHGLTTPDVEAIFRAKDFAARQSFPRERLEGEGIVRGKLYRVVYTQPGPDEVYVITAFRTRRRRT